jgi:hypothetical protein
VAFLKIFNPVCFVPFPLDILMEGDTVTTEMVMHYLLGKICSIIFFLDITGVIISFFLFVLFYLRLLRVASGGMYHRLDPK